MKLIQPSNLMIYYGINNDGSKMYVKKCANEITKKIRAMNWEHKNKIMSVIVGVEPLFPIAAALIVTPPTMLAIHAAEPYVQAQLGIAMSPDIEIGLTSAFVIPYFFWTAKRTSRGFSKLQKHLGLWR